MHCKQVQSRDDLDKNSIVTALIDEITSYAGSSSSSSSTSSSSTSSSSTSSGSAGSSEDNKIDFAEIDRDSSYRLLLKEINSFTLKSIGSTDYSQNRDGDGDRDRDSRTSNKRINDEAKPATGSESYSSAVPSGTPALGFTDSLTHVSESLILSR